MLYLISYDVSDDTRRRRVFEALKDYGRRVQFSVFECDLDDKALETLSGRIDLEIERGQDSCRFYRLCENCARAVRVIGSGDRYSEPACYVV